MPRQNQNIRRDGEQPQNNYGRRDFNSREMNDRRDDRRQQTAPTNRMTAIGRSYAAVTAGPGAGQHSNQQEGPRRVRSRQNLSRRNSFNASDENTPLHQQISLQRKRSFRREENHEEKLQAEIKRMQSQLDDMRNTTNTPDITRGNNSHNNPHRIPMQKNANTTQRNGMGVNQETMIKEAFTFVTDAMATLKQFETKFSTILNNHGTHPDRS